MSLTIGPAVPTGLGIRVAMVDSGWKRGIDQPRVTGGWSFINAAGDAISEPMAEDDDQLGHGTTCTRLFLEAAPGATVVPLRVFQRKRQTSALAVRHAMEWCIRNRIKLINLSLGTRELHSRDDLYRVCHKASTAGAIIVAAARGNTYPSVFDVVLSVGPALDDEGPEFEYRPDEPVEIVVRSRRLDHCGQRIRASSYLAPMVSARIACILERHPELTLTSLRQFLRTRGLEDAR